LSGIEPVIGLSLMITRLSAGRLAWLVG
jgi:hypothetical protein